MKYEIVRYVPEFRDQVVALQRYHWGPDLSLNSAYLRWKYEQNPYISSPHIYLALYSGKVVGMRGAYGTKWQAGDPLQEFVVPCLGDSVVKPKHRRKGLLSALTTKALEDLGKQGYPNVFNLTAGEATFRASMKMGWRSLGSLSQVKRVSILTKLKLQALGVFGVSRLFQLGNPQPFLQVDRRGSHLNETVSLELQPRHDSMEKLVTRTATNEHIRQVRDAAFFTWRFLNPFSTYRFLYLEDTNLQAYLVLQASLYRNNFQISIVDFEAMNAKFFATLLSEVIVLSHSAPLTIWSSTLSADLRKVLVNFRFKSDGYFSGPRKDLPTVTLGTSFNNKLKRNWTPDMRQLFDLDNWDMRMIYSDSY